MAPSADGHSKLRWLALPKGCHVRNDGLRNFALNYKNDITTAQYCNYRPYCIYNNTPHTSINKITTKKARRRRLFAIRPDGPSEVSTMRTPINRPRRRAPFLVLPKNSSTRAAHIPALFI